MGCTYTLLRATKHKQIFVGFLRSPEFIWFDPGKDQSLVYLKLQTMNDHLEREMNDVSASPNSFVYLFLKEI